MRVFLILVPRKDQRSSLWVWVFWGLGFWVWAKGLRSTLRALTVEIRSWDMKAPEGMLPITTHASLVITSVVGDGKTPQP